MTTFEQLYKAEIIVSVNLPRRPNVPTTEAPAVIFFSSGSTGTPKAIIRSHRNVVVVCSPKRKFGSFLGGRGSIVTGHQPLAHGSGNITITHAITYGFTVVFNATFTAESFLDTVETYRVS